MTQRTPRVSAVTLRIVKTTLRFSNNARRATRSSTGRGQRAMFVAETPDLIVDLVPNMARLVHFLFESAGRLRRIGKRPMQPGGHAREDWTPSGFRFVANRDHVGEQFARFENIEHGLCFV